jgi:hypothetical protein
MLVEIWPLDICSRNSEEEMGDLQFGSCIWALSFRLASVQYGQVPGRAVSGPTV